VLSDCSVYSYPHPNGLCHHCADVIHAVDILVTSRRTFGVPDNFLYVHLKTAHMLSCCSSFYHLSRYLEDKSSFFTQSDQTSYTYSSTGTMFGIVFGVKRSTVVVLVYWEAGVGVFKLTVSC